MATAVVSVFLPDIYRASATIMPIGGQRLGGIASIAAQAGLLGDFNTGPSSTNQLMAILKSKTMAETIIDKYTLVPVFYPDLWDTNLKQWKTEDLNKRPTKQDVVADLLAAVAFSEDKRSQTITLSADMKDAEYAAKIVNGYIQELSAYIRANTFTTAKRNRIFIEHQLEKNNKALLEAGKELTAFYAAGKLSQGSPTLNIDVSTLNLNPPGDTRSFDANANNLNPQNSPLEQQTLVLQKKIDETLVVRNVPQQVYMQYLSLRHNLLGELNGLLTQQYELAKIKEAQEDLSFQIIDMAQVPEKKFKPNRKQLVVIMFAFSLFLAGIYVFFKEYFIRIKAGGQA